MSRMKTFRNLQPRGRTRLRVAAVLAAAVAILIPQASALAQSTYTIKDLGTLPGATSCAAYALSILGEVAGSCTGQDSAFDEVAFSWRDGVMINLGKLSKAHYSRAEGINARGQMVGEGDTGDFRPHPTLYRDGTVIDIDASGGNARGIFITDTAVIVGNYSKGFGNVSSWSAVIWKERPTQPGRFDRLSLQPYPGGDSKVRYGYATAANNNVQVVGWVQNSLFGQMGAFWNNDANHTLALLQPLPGDWTSIAWGMNDMGQAVGESHPPFHSRAVQWSNDAAHTPIELGMIPGDTDSTAMAINNLGQIVGTSSVPNVLTHPVLWDSGAVFDLNAVLDDSGIGWVIAEATAINNAGQIAGFGFHNGQFAAFLMAPVAQ